MDNGDFEAAAREFRTAANQDPNDVARWMELGRAELAADRPSRARPAFERAAALEPRNPRPRIWIGRSWELQRKYEEAALAYSQAIEIAPRDAFPQRVLGTRLLRWGQYAEAIPPLERAVALDARHADTWNALALARYHADDIEGAEKAFRQGIARNPDDRGLRVGLAAVLVNTRQFAEALAVYDAIVERWPDFAAAHVGRAILLHELGRRRDAERAFMRAIEVARDPRPYKVRLARYRAQFLRARR